MDIFHTTSLVIPLTAAPLQNGAVAVSGGRIIEIDTLDNLIKNYSPSSPTVHHTNNLIIPAFVNTHTHLEYANTHIPPLSGHESFFNWIIELNKVSRGWDKQRLIQNIIESLETLSRGGVGLIGDNGFSGLATEILADYPINSLYFQEYFGLGSAVDVPDKLAGLNKAVKPEHTLNELRHNSSHEVGISPHSLYTANTTLWTKLIDMYPDKRFSSHIAESRDESDFFYRGENAEIARFYNSVLPQLQYEHPYHKKQTPYSILAEAGILEKLKGMLISVHNVNISDNDIKLLKSYDIEVVLCPRSNRYLNNGLPPFDKLYEAGLNLSIGTDSLSSNWGLDMFSEMQEIAQSSSIPAIDILRMATMNGAKALGFDEVTGSLDKGKYFDAVELDIKVNMRGSDDALYRTIISSGRSSVAARYHKGEKVFG